MQAPAPMKVLVCCDDFKGTLEAQAVGDCIIAGLPKNSISRNVPLSDGGHGFLRAMKCASPELEVHHVQVMGPAGRGVLAQYLVHPKNEFCVLEMAQSSGLVSVPSHSQDPRHTTTFGLGQMIAHVTKQGAKKIFLGLGGSGTNDMGIPALQAMGIIKARIGIQWFDQSSLPLTGGMLARIDELKYFPEAASAFPSIMLISDVTNPLLGPKGATEIYGPQKGAKTTERRAVLEGGLAKMATLIQGIKPTVKFGQMTGGGAAGGVSAGFQSLLNAKWQEGSVAFAEICKLRDHVQWADVVFTGEGRYDHQTVDHGKTISIVIKLCQELKKRLVVVCGQADDNTRSSGNVEVLSLVPTYPVEDAMHLTRKCVTEIVTKKFNPKAPASKL